MTNVWKTKEAYFVRLDDGRMECMLSTDFLASLFGPDWRNQEIYIGHAGWTAGTRGQVLYFDIDGYNHFFEHHASIESPVPFAPTPSHAKRAPSLLA